MRKYPYPLPGKLMQGIPMGRGVSKANYFKAKCGAYLEFPEGGGGVWNGGGSNYKNVLGEGP